MEYTKLSDRIANLEEILGVGRITSDEFYSSVLAALKDDDDKRKSKSARYVIRITNDTKGAYKYGTNSHYVNTGDECDELFNEWFQQEIAATTSATIDGTEVTSAIKTINGGDVTTSFILVDRQYERGNL